MKLAIVQIIVAAVIVILVLLQERSSGLSSVFGGEGAVYQTRRGMERWIFFFTILLTVVFVVLAIAQLLL